MNAMSQVDNVSVGEAVMITEVTSVESISTVDTSTVTATSVEAVAPTTMVSIGEAVVSVGLEPSKTISQCSPLFKTGIDVLDRVLFCVGDKGVTVSIVVAVAFFVLLLLRRRR